MHDADCRDKICIKQGKISVTVCGGDYDVVS